MNTSNPYTYQHADGQIIDLSALLDSKTKEEVACIAGQESRKNALLRAVNAMKNAGEYEELKQILRLCGIGL